MAATQRLAVLLLLLITASTSATAIDHIIVNSEDWKDVYSTIMYSNLENIPKNFLVSDRHSNILAQTLERNKNDILLVSSPEYPFVVGYDSVLRAAGFNVEQIAPDNINLELARRTDITRFVIVDDSYGYNAMAVAPYAALEKGYVIFADRRNIADITDFLRSITVEELVIYGFVDREVKAALAEFSPVIINKGDRFDNNIEIVKLYQEKHRELKGDINKQIVLSNGEFIEEEIMSGAEPVLFLGRENVPEQIQEYIKESGVDVAVLIGNQYVGAATNIRRQIGISVFVKFARGARIPSGPVSPVEGLDLFYVPTYQITLQIASIKYNSATNMLEVTIQNTGVVAAYFKGSYSLASELGAQGTVGDMDAGFIDANSIKTMTYEVSLTGQNLTADAYVIYGESGRSLENEIRKRWNIESVRVIDNSLIEITSAKYDLNKGIFYVEVSNTGDADAYVDIELIDIIIDGETYSFGSEEVALVQAGRNLEIRIRSKPVMQEIDLADNEKIMVQANYGERAENLIKSARKELALEIKKLDYMYIAGAVALIAVILLMIFIFKKKKCPECKHRNPSRRKNCRKCGADL
ncbi:MAG: hypothetical protein ABIF10_03960 [Candidatus Woesearchaeota archaeon]